MSNDDSVATHRFRKTLEELDKNTFEEEFLISVYVPYGIDRRDVLVRMYCERETAKNIKSERKRTTIIAVLDKVADRLMLFEKIPTNGLVIFGGPDKYRLNEGIIVVSHMVPPKPINTFYYWTDRKYKTDVLWDMLKE